MRTIGIKPAQQFTTADRLREAWAVADEAGFDSAWVFDHFAPMGRVRSGDVFEAWTLLAAMAVATRRIRIGCLVTGNGYRHPALLAKMAVTVDHLSGGRLELGLGAGGDPLTDPALGLPLPPAPQRIARLAEACALLRALWTRPLTDSAGPYYPVTGAEAEPKPVQSPGPPLWLGSAGERLGLRVVAEHADVWVSGQLPGVEAGEFGRLSAVLDRHCAAVGRDPATVRRAIQIRPGDRDATLRAAAGYAAAGATDLVLMGDPADAAALLPDLRAL
jgi:alkanesulfonate monooxygenase SsuD/methylene tetrahydromethanopterin reductase-like flavin-dependent oxidoreductase (luciferase family)